MSVLDFIKRLGADVGIGNQSSNWTSVVPQGATPNPAAVANKTIPQNEIIAQGNGPGFPAQTPIGPVGHGIQATVESSMITPFGGATPLPLPQIGAPQGPPSILDMLQSAHRINQFRVAQQNAPTPGNGLTETGAAPPATVNVPGSSQQVPYAQSLNGPPTPAQHRQNLMDKILGVF